MHNKLFLLCSLLSCFFIILAIQISDGFFGWIAFGLVVLSFFLEIFSIWVLFKPQIAVLIENQAIKRVGDALISILVFLLMLEVGTGLFKPYIKYNQIYFLPFLLKITNGVSLLLIATYFLKKRPEFLKNRFLILFLVNLLGKVLVVWASPYPLIDAWQMMQQSSSYFFRGMNPYSTPIWDIYHNLEITSFKGFIYLPMALIFIFPFYVIFGDVRLAMIAGEAVGIMAIYRLGKKKFWQRDTARWLELIILVFLLQPRGFLVIEQSWNEPLITGILALFLYGYCLRHHWADFSLGLFLAIKQSLLFCFIPLFNLYKFNYRRYLIVVIFTFLLVIFPFFFWDMDAFWRINIKFHLEGGPRFDTLTLTSFLRHAFFIDLPTWVGLVMGVITAIISGIILRRFGLAGYLKSLVLTYLALFMFGSKWAFCNSYYFLTFLQVVSIFFFTICIEPDIYLLCPEDRNEYF